MAIDKFLWLYNSHILDISSSITGAINPPKIKAVISVGNAFSFKTGSSIIPASINKVVITTPKKISNTQLKTKRDIVPNIFLNMDVGSGDDLEGCK